MKKIALTLLIFFIISCFIVCIILLSKINQNLLIIIAHQKTSDIVKNAQEHFKVMPIYDTHCTKWGDDDLHCETRQRE